VQGRNALGETELFALLRRTLGERSRNAVKTVGLDGLVEVGKREIKGLFVAGRREQEPAAGLC